MTKTVVAVLEKFVVKKKKRQTNVTLMEMNTLLDNKFTPNLFHVTSAIANLDLITALLSITLIVKSLIADSFYDTVTKYFAGAFPFILKTITHAAPSIGVVVSFDWV